MTKGPPFDPRVVANFLIDVAWDFEISITHLSLQKTLYFLHGRYLKEFSEPLIQGYFEAWKHGPVHPQIWSTFKSSGSAQIKHHAYGLDLLTGASRKLPAIEDKKLKLFITTRGSEFLSIPAPRLVGLSHAKGGPWDRVTKLSGGQREYGARISDELILECFHRHMIPIREIEDLGDDLYEQPPT